LIVGLLVNRAKRRQGEAEATLIADISSKFVNLPSGEVDREIMDAERRICEFLDLDISAIWQWSEGSTGGFMLTHYYSAQDGPQPSIRLNQEDFPWFRQLMLEGRIVPISSLDDMPAEAAHDRENCRRLGVKSNLCIPLMVGGQPVGILGLNTTRAERKWPDALVKRLQLVAQIFTNALERKRADQALRESQVRLNLAAEDLDDRLSFETLITDLSARLVAASSTEVDGEIEEVLNILLRFFRCERCGLLEVDRDKNRVCITHARYADGVEEVSKSQNLEPHFPWTIPRIIDLGLHVSFSRIDELPAEAAADSASWVAMGTKSSLNIPISAAGCVRHIMVIHSIREEREWPESYIPRLRLLGEMCANALVRKHADEALRESELRLSLAAESADAGLWVLDYETQEFWVTEKARAIFGYPPSVAIGIERIQASVHPDDWKLVQENLDRSWRAGDPVDIEYRIVLGDGRERWIASRGRSVFKPTGEPERLLGLSMDITGRKRAEEAFRTSEARLAAGTELAGLGCYEFDFSERTSFVDDRFHAICGVPAGHHHDIQALEFWMKHLHPDDLPWIMDEREKLHDGRIERISVEYRYLHPTEGLKWLHHLARVEVRDATGRGVRTYGVVRDVTTRRSAELEAHEMRGNLAHAGRVTLLGQLASALAHELSQPLGAILRNAEAAEIMLQSAEPDLYELRAIVKDILHDDARAGNVIDRLRSLLKRRSVDTQPIDLPSVITEVLALVQADAAARQVKIAFSAMPGLPTVSGDRVHLQQVILNLLVNAMDALEGCAPDQRTIQVSALRLDPATVEVRVVDNGPGIPGESLERLFEPFFTTKSTGMGMGLPISKTIIEAHKGKLWAENGPECGACFCFTVPVDDGKQGMASAIRIGNSL